MRQQLFRLFLTLLLVVTLPLAARAQGVVLDDETAAKLAPPGYDLGPKEKDVPAWPLIKAGMVAGYVYETGKLASIPGFSGTPINLLVAMDTQGQFLDVQILHQAEPVFVEGLGPQPLVEFLNQYRGKSIRQNIKIGSAYGGSDKGNSTSVTLDGVLKATASVRIANLTILAASTKVAQAKMAGVAPRPKSTPKEDVGPALPWDELVAKGHVGHLRLSNADVEKAFAGTSFAGRDPEALSDPDGLFTDLWFAYLNSPAIGPTVLGERQYQHLRGRLQEGEQALLVWSSGRYRYIPDDFVPATVPDLLALDQGGFPVNIRDMVHDYSLPPGLPEGEELRIFRIDGSAPFDPASPWTLSLRVVREKGMFMPETEARDFKADYALPATLFIAPVVDNAPEWLSAWTDRLPELSILGLMLLALTGALVMQQRLSRNERLFYAIRLSYLAATLVFIGWYAQGQLSIVTVQGVMKGFRQGFDFGFLLYDPISLLLWAYVAVAAIVWGRGTFCGWLCPFGALQEFSHWLGKLLRFPQVKVPAWLDGRLVLVKYGALAALLAVAVIAPAQAEKAAEVEPFKTAITLGFVRDLPFVVYAVGLVVLGAFLFKPFCRYMCPLGAFLAVVGRLRLWDWIPRQKACGSPCQLCTARCKYKAIRRDGSIRYDECFQCLDCVGIYADAKRCVPKVLAAKRGAGYVPQPRRAAHGA